MTKSTASRFIRQYSTAWSASRGDVELVDVGDADQDDRQIAGYAQGPQTWLPTTAVFDGLRRRTQHRRGVDDVSGQALVLPALLAVDAEVVQLHLGLRPSERGRALERADIVVLVDQIEDLRARRGDHRPEIDRVPSLPARSAHAGAGRILDQAPLRSRPTVDGRSSPRSSARLCRRDRGTAHDRSRTRACPPPRHRQPPGAQPRPAAPLVPAAASSPTMAPRPARCSVSMNSFENAGCATSAAWDARTSSAYEVTSISRG